MRDHETAMQVYVQLAAFSNRMKQPLVRDRFLLLGGVEACMAGWLEIAEICRRKIVAANPAHQLHRFASMPDALRNEGFQNLVAHWQRYCPFEKAEAMLRELNLDTSSTSNLTIGEQMGKLLEDESQSS